MTAGGMTFKVSFDGGSTFVTASEGPRLAMEIVYPHGDDSEIVAMGFNPQGAVDYQYTTSLQGGWTYVSEEFRDTNEDGDFDRQEESIVDVDGGLPYQLTETVWQYLDDGHRFGRCRHLGPGVDLVGAGQCGVWNSEAQIPLHQWVQRVSVGSQRRVGVHLGQHSGNESEGGGPSGRRD